MADTHAFKHTPRERLTDQQRAKLFLDAGGRCYVCTRKIRPGETWEDEHENALETGGGNEIENRRVICQNCHKPKTVKDHKTAAKIRAVAVSHIIPNSQRQKKGRPMPGTKRSGWKKTFNDGWVRR